MKVILLLTLLIVARTFDLQLVQQKVKTLNLNQTVDLVNGVLLGLKIAANKDEVMHCVQGGLDFTNLADHDWNTVIYWEQNGIQQIPMVNKSLIVGLFDQVFDDTENLVRKCGGMGENTFYFFKRIIENLSTSQGWADMLVRLKTEGLLMGVEIFQGVQDILAEKYEDAGLQFGTALDRLIEEQTSTVRNQQLKLAQLIQLNRFKQSSQILTSIVNKVQEQLVDVQIQDPLDVFKQIMLGVVQGLMHLSDAPDFIGCVFKGMSAAAYFKSLTPDNVRNYTGLADTIKGTKGVLSPLLNDCLQGVDDILNRIDQLLEFINDFSLEVVGKVFYAQADELARAIADSIKQYVTGDIQGGTATLVVIMEDLIYQIYINDNPMVNQLQLQ